MSVLNRLRVRRSRSLHLESLETRRLLAVDLVVEQLTPLPAVSEGEQVTYQIQVTNNGPDDAVGATIRDPVSQYLDSATWTRDVTFHLDADSLNGANGFWAAGQNGTGDSVSGIGDINADGIEDFAVSAIGGLGPNGEHSTGRTHIVFGGSNVGAAGHIDFSTLDASDDVNGIIIYGAESNDQSGKLVRAAGDVNADGVDDMLVANAGRQRFDPDLERYVTENQTSYIVFGSPEFGRSGHIRLSNLDGTNGFSIEKLNRVDGPADFNGDGVNDILLADPHTDAESPNRGKAFVVFGGSGLGNGGTLDTSALDGTDGFVIDSAGLEAINGPGINVSVADTNGDDVDDILIGMSQSEHRRPNVSSVYVIYGGKQVGGAGTIGLNNLNGSEGGLFVKAVDAVDLHHRIEIQGVGDINADGFDDFAMLGYSEFSDSSSAFIVFGRPAVPEIPLQPTEPDGRDGFMLDGIERDRTGNRTIADINRAGDVNGDGIDDFLVGVPIFEVPNDLEPNPGSTYIIFGSDDLGMTNGVVDVRTISAHQGFVFQGVLLHDMSGNQVSSAGDVNADGIDDILISARGVNGYAGGAYVVYGQRPTTVSGVGTGDIVEAINVRVGTTITYSVTGVVRPGEGGRLVTKSVVNPAADQPELDPPTNSVPDIDPGLLVDLAVELEGVPEELNPGQEVSYTLRVRNDGRDDATDVVINHAVVELLESPTWTRNVEFEFDSTNLTPGVGIHVDGIDLGFADSRRLTRAGDMNGDGLDDFAYADSNSDKVYVVLGSADLMQGIDLTALDGDDGFVVSGDELVYSLSDAGDFNGDGFDDLIFGHSKNGQHVGTVVFGGPTIGEGSALELGQLDKENGVVIIGPEGSKSNWIVSNAGDLNDDDMNDVFLWARHTDELYIVFGGDRFGDTSGPLDLNSLDGTDGFSIQGLTQGVPAWERPVHVAIAGGGDINGDGVQDLVIGRPRALDDGDLSVLYGHERVGADGSIQLTDFDVTKTSIRNSYDFYDLRNLSINGDVNGDGLDDILLGNGYGVGIVLGSSRISVSHAGLNYFRSSEAIYSRVDYDARYVGDVNADGLDDFIYGTETSYIDDELFDESAGIVFGSHKIGSSTRVFQELTGELGTRLEGIRGPVSAAGDIVEAVDIPVGTTITYTVNGIVPEEVVDSLQLTASATPSAPQIEYRPANNSVGRIISIPSPDLQVFVTEQPPGPVEAGGLATYVVEVTNEGDDVTVSACIEGAFENLVDVTWNRTTDFDPSISVDLAELTRANSFTVEGNERDQRVGQNISAVGDLNADGFDDVTIATANAVAVVFGRGSSDGPNLQLPDLNGSNGFVFQNIADDLRSRVHASRAGDVNGDGIDDLLLGVPDATINETRFAGKVFVVFGSETLGATGSFDLTQLDGANGYVIDGPSCCGFGSQVAGAGDVNGDGVDDFMVVQAASFVDEVPVERETFVFFGGTQVGAGGSLQSTALDGTHGFVIRGSELGSFVGWKISATGDVNGDGIDDLLIGDHPEFVFANTNEAFVVFGADSIGDGGQLLLEDLDGNNGFRIQGTFGFGTSIAAGSDINTDGLADLLFGLSIASPNGIDRAGQVIALFGKPGIGVDGLIELSNTDAADLLFNGTNAKDSVGGSITTSDVNGDGVADIVTTGSLQTAVVYGSSKFSDRHEFNLSEIDGRNGFFIAGNHSAVGGAGDFNGDGVEDILIGDSPARPNGLQNAGSVYVLFGQGESGQVSLRQVLDIPSRGTVTYTISGMVTASSASTATISFTADAGAGQRDSDITNNFAIAVTAVVETLPADIDGNGEVDFIDFLILANNFGKEGGPEDGDIDSDGRVDFTDFLLLAQQFGRRVSIE